LQSSDNANTRENEVQHFRAHQGHAILVAGIAVGGVAIDWSCATHAVFAELDWTPANVQQAEMRTFSPLRPSVVVYLYVDAEIEQKLINALAVKEGFQQSIGLGLAEITRAVLGR
jgi:hypothetical protein